MSQNIDQESGETKTRDPSAPPLTCRLRAHAPEAAEHAELAISLADWCAFHALLAATRVFQSELLCRIGHGAPVPRSDSLKAALRLQKLLDEHPQTKHISVTAACGHLRRRLQADPTERFSICRARVDAFITFCRGSGGFCVH